MDNVLAERGSSDVGGRERRAPVERRARAVGSGLASARKPGAIILKYKNGAAVPEKWRTLLYFRARTGPEPGLKNQK